MIKEGQLAQLLEAYLAANLATNMLWAIYCVWCRKHYGTGAGAIDHRGKARYNPLYILYKDAEAKRLVAKKLGRHYIGIELNEAYIGMAQKRVAAVPARLDRWAEAGI